MSFGKAISIVSRDGFLKLVLPEWAMHFTPRLRRTKAAFDEVWAYMDELVESYHENRTSFMDRGDLFSSLLRANQEAEGGTEHLNKNELFGMVPRVCSD